jgi:biotin transport system substrate-specific component
MTPVLSETLLPAVGARLWLKRALLVALGVAALTVAAKIRVPFWPVPITMQTFVVLGLGAAYGLRLGVATVLGYLLLGALGLGVFTGDGAGLAYMAGSTGGYLAGFVLATAFLGWAARRGWDRSMPMMALAMLGGSALIYLPGVLWLGFLFGFDQPILAWGLYPFLLGDALKLVLAALLFPALWRVAGDARG